MSRPGRCGSRPATSRPNGGKSQIVTYQFHFDVVLQNLGFLMQGLQMTIFLSIGALMLL